MGASTSNHILVLEPVHLLVKLQAYGCNSQMYLSKNVCSVFVVVWAFLSGEFEVLFHKHSCLDQTDEGPHADY